MFFSVPLLRTVGVARENAKRAARNVRKILVGLVSKVSLGGSKAEPLAGPEAVSRVREVLSGKAHAKVDVGGSLDRLVAEFDGDVEPGADGALSFRFPGFRRQVAAAHHARLQMALERRRVGDIVYSSDDEPAEQGRRDLEAFDRELAAGAPGAGEDALTPSDTESDQPLALPPADDLTAYLNDPLRTGYRDERELAAMQQQMREQAAARR
jgi:hypothetical protein